MYTLMNYDALYSGTPVAAVGSPLLPYVSAVILVLIIWSLAWKGLALWRAAREGSKPWFVALLLINTLGLLEIVYLFVFSKKKDSID